MEVIPYLDELGLPYKSAYLYYNDIVNYIYERNKGKHETNLIKKCRKNFEIIRNQKVIIEYYFEPIEYTDKKGIKRITYFRHTIITPNQIIEDTLDLIQKDLSIYYSNYMQNNDISCCIKINTIIFETTDKSVRIARPLNFKESKSIIDLIDLI